MNPPQPLSSSNTTLRPLFLHNNTLEFLQSSAESFLLELLCKLLNKWMELEMTFSRRLFKQRTSLETTPSSTPTVLCFIYLFMQTLVLFFFSAFSKFFSPSCNSISDCGIVKQFLRKLLYVNNKL